MIRPIGCFRNENYEPIFVCRSPAIVIPSLTTTVPRTTSILLITRVVYRLRTIALTCTNKSISLPISRDSKELITVTGAAVLLLLAILMPISPDVE